VAREKLPYWDRLWNDCCQEEIRRSRDVDDNEEEENLALTSKRGGRGRRGTTFRGDSQVENQRKICHMSNVMCVESLDTLLASALKLRRDLVKEGEERR
jgi:hypothetical protein